MAAVKGFRTIRINNLPLESHPGYAQKITLQERAASDLEL